MTHQRSGRVWRPVALLGELLKQGEAETTIILCAWDGEEEGLLGSTEWVETHADELKQKPSRVSETPTAPAKGG